MRLAEAAGNLANIKFFFHLLAPTLFHSLVNYVRNHMKVVFSSKKSLYYVLQSSKKMKENFYCVNNGSHALASIIGKLRDQGSKFSHETR